MAIIDRIRAIRDIGVTDDMSPEDAKYVRHLNLWSVFIMPFFLYPSLGSAVNLASRIENASAPDKITISHTTYLLIEDEIKCEPKGEIEIKGFTEPVKIYEVLGDKS